MIERLLILVSLMVLSTLAYRLLRCWQIQRAGQIAPCDPLLASMRRGIPAILYFTTPTCAPCKTVQRPALQHLLAELGDLVQVIEVNALEHPDAADRWGVLSVPTTFILDAKGRPREINHGVAGADKLKQQLQQIA